MRFDFGGLQGKYPPSECEPHLREPSAREIFERFAPEFFSFFGKNPFL